MDALAAMRRDLRELVAWVEKKKEQGQQLGESAIDGEEGYGAEGLIDEMMEEQEREQRKEKERDGEFAGKAGPSLTAVPDESARAMEKPAMVTVAAVGS